MALASTYNLICSNSGTWSRGEHPTTIDRSKARQVAEAYTAAWNFGSAEAVAEFYAPDGRIVINRGEPWQRRVRVGEMMAESPNAI